MRSLGLWWQVITSFEEGNPRHNTRITEDLALGTAQAFLNLLLEKIRLGLLTDATQIEQPGEAVIEMEIVGSLDEDAITFVGCEPLTRTKFN